MRKDENQFANALATLASMYLDYRNRVQLISIEIRNYLVHCYSVEGEVDENQWYYDIKQFIQHQKYPRGGIQYRDENPMKVSHELLPRCRSVIQ